MTGAAERKLAGRVAVISGASHGLGRAVATGLAELGAEVVCLARGQERLAEVVAQLTAAGQHALGRSCDVADAGQVKLLADELRERFGRVDILVNNVGAPAPRSLQETSARDWDEAIAVNLSGAFYLTRGLWELLLASEAAYVFTISGTAGLRAGASPAYSAAKFGLTGLTRAIAQSGGEHGLRATVIYPGSMDTGWRGAPLGALPASETMDPAEVARYLAYLACTPPEFVVNEAVLNPLDATWQ